MIAFVFPKARTFPRTFVPRIPRARLTRFLKRSAAPRARALIPLLGALIAALPLSPRAQDEPDHPALEAAPDPVAAIPSDLAATLVLERARARHGAGAFAAEVICVRESFLSGRDTLRGVLEAGPAPGERRLSLRGAEDAFEWWSRGDGAEQWRREGLEGRARRLAPYSRKKPSFAPDVSYEDLVRLPFGYLEGHRGARRVSETDSTVTLALAPGGALAALYASMTVTLGKRDALLRRVEFKGNGGRPSRVLSITRYVGTPSGVWPAELVFASADGLTSARLLLSPRPQGAARDKADGEARGAASGFAEPRWNPRETVLP